MDRLSERILAPLSRYYADPKTVELRISRPHHVVVERRGVGKEEFEDDELSRGAIESIARSLANKNGLVFDGEENVKLSCVLSGGHRFECLVGNSTQSGVSLAANIHLSRNGTSGAFRKRHRPTSRRPSRKRQTLSSLERPTLERRPY